jgi:hypothetical protein
MPHANKLQSTIVAVMALLTTFDIQMDVQR